MPVHLKLYIADSQVHAVDNIIYPNINLQACPKFSDSVQCVDPFPMVYIKIILILFLN